MRFTVNNTEYWIDEFDSGFAWVSKKDEALFAFPTELEAYQNALDHEALLATWKRDGDLRLIDEARYGTYDQQVRNHYREVTAL